MKRGLQALIATILFFVGSAWGLYLFTEATVSHPLLTYLAEVSFVIQMIGLIWLIVVGIKTLLNK